MTFSLEDLNGRIAERSIASSEESYTARLLRDGVDRCARKFGEEAVELIVSAVSRDRQGVTSEAADVIYHLLVLLKSAGITLEQVMAELEHRTAQSGLDEKASRSR
jgi:phosphoribosyl-ATP pyrophosphohydrolase